MNDRYYREGTTKTYNARTQMQPEEIRELFIKIGWLGRLRTKGKSA